MRVSLPLLVEHVPLGWTVSLVDTPGFGEARQHIQQLAKDSVQLSAAYIFLVSNESIEASDVSETFKDLAKTDQGM